MIDWLWHPVKDSKPYWMEFVGPTLTLLLAIFGYWWALKVWKKQKSIEQHIWSGQQVETARVAACKAVWGLLAFMSEKEHSKTVFVKRGDNQHKTNHLRVAQAKEYLQKIEEVWFLQGHGLLISQGVRDDIFEFRSRVYRFLEKEQRKVGAGNELPDLIEVEEERLVSEVAALRERLNTTLRKEIGKGLHVEVLEG
ncbi:MAG: hypothetical protein J0L99_14775 [Chitinophagales bacterium]|nr:hypothetical protein [Chitinophagales bacterium]